MIGYLYTSALKDFLRPMRVLVWLLVAVVVGLLARFLSDRMSLGAPLAQYGQISPTLNYKVMALAAAIFASNVVSQEVEQKTIVYLLTRPIPRGHIILARMLASATATFLVTLMTVFAVSIMIRDVGPFSVAVMNDMKALALASLAYTGLFTFVTLIINKAMIVNLMFAFGWELAVVNMTGSAYYLSINSYVLTLANHVESPQYKAATRFFAGQILGPRISDATAYVVLGTLILSLVGLLMYWFTKFEFVPREDTE